MLRKLIQASAILILLTGDAFSQPGSGSGNTGSSMPPMTLSPSERRRTPEELQRDREIEAQYNRTVNEKIPDKKATGRPLGEHPLRPGVFGQQATALKSWGCHPEDVPAHILSRLGKVQRKRRLRRDATGVALSWSYFFFFFGFASALGSILASSRASDSSAEA